ncbi:hypothetical protein CH253_07990 [Rhodococcus sp. 06-156-3C]|uniref:hypothetical protein n=1 Tax=Rhodococcus sp. 06-156-3C TaxID=2022486 RepID=UPI000B9B0E07|nr:hypothetical protein [Rhodococcus sp. 06-156-3C]OZD23793.1 hypothetical protein CH253_07990 [Rhodococcus sp. 06-156-3C]
MTTATAPKLAAYYVDGGTIVMAYSESDALAKIESIIDANLTDYPDVNPGRTLADVELPTEATLKAD